MLKVWAVHSLLCYLLLPVATCGTVTPVVPSELRNRQSPLGIVTGVTWRDNNGNVGLRREIRDLKDNYPDQWNLYLLALARIQWKPPQQTDPLSYFGIANIHGRPFKTWGDSPGIPDKIGKEGYCPHNNMLFLGWHRPYLALFEEQLYKAMQEYADDAADLTVRKRYQAAADSFRMPYWDWALGPKNGSVPDFFTQPRILVTLPDGNTKDVWNPLYAYYFAPTIPDGFTDKYRHINSTQRWPTSNEPSSTSQQRNFVSNFEGLRSVLHDAVAGAFQKPTMNEFANDIQGIHGWVHGTIGGYPDAAPFEGHMWPLEYSSYEPLFWLHHATVDRFFAMYQAMKPDAWFTKTNVGGAGNVWIEENSEVDADTKLLPFRKADGEYWSTNDARSTVMLGYAYPDTFKPNNVTDEDHIESVKTTVTEKYGSSVRATLVAEAATAGDRALLSQDRNFTDWSIKAETLTSFVSSFVARFRLQGLESTNTPVDAGLWMKLMTRSDAVTSKSASESEKPYQGSISLTAVLLDQITTGRLRSLNEQDVVPFLNEHLQATISAGTSKDTASINLSSFKFEVVSSEAHIPNVSTEPMIYGEPVPHPDVIVKAGGGVA